MKKKPIVSFNIIRAVAAISIFLYHAYWNMGCDYAYLNPIIGQSSFFMTLFFILSGFVLYYNYEDEDLLNKENLGRYYVKRITSIYPLYFLVWIVFYFLQWKSNTVSRDFFTLPYQYLLIQNITEYPYLMNSGTWFLSCMMICYLISPFLIKAFHMIENKKNVWRSIFIIVILLAFMPLLYYLYGGGVEIYHNAFGRIFEFSLGILLCRLAEIRPNDDETSEKNAAVMACYGLFFSAASCIVIYILRTRIEPVINYQEWLKPIGAILGGAVVYFYYLGQTDVVDKIAQCKVIRFFSDYSLEFWIATFFTTEIYNYFIRNLVTAQKKYVGIEIIITFTMNLILAILLKQYNRAVKKFVNKAGFKRFCLSVLGIFLALILVKAVTVIPDAVRKANHVYHVGQEVTFGIAGRNGNSYIIKGISHPEEGFAWTDGKVAELCFNDLEGGSYHVKIDLGGIYNNSQTVLVKVNGETVYSSVINAKNVDAGIEFDIDIEKDIDMVISLPDAISPAETGESSDARLLALQIKSIVIFPL